MIRATILVKGEVQKVGYRDLVQSVARSLDIKGYVENLRDGTVRIIGEAEEAVIEEFIQKISVQTEFIHVEEARVIERALATGEFPYFDVKYGSLEEELGERIVTAVKMASASRQDVKAMHTDLTKGFQETRGDIQSMHADLTKGFQDVRGDLTKDFQETRGAIQSMHSDMNRSFQEMAKRYDHIIVMLGKTLKTMQMESLRTRRELVRAVDKLARLVDALVKERGRKRGAGRAAGRA